MENIPFINFSMIHLLYILSYIACIRRCVCEYIQSHSTHEQRYKIYVNEMNGGLNLVARDICEEAGRG